MYLFKRPKCMQEQKSEMTCCIYSPFIAIASNKNQFSFDKTNGICGKLTKVEKPN